MSQSRESEAPRPGHFAFTQPLLLTIPKSILRWSKAADDELCTVLVALKDIFSLLACWSPLDLPLLLDTAVILPMVSLCKDGWAPNGLLQPCWPLPAVLVPQCSGSGVLPSAGTYRELRGLPGPLLSCGQ